MSGTPTNAVVKNPMSGYSHIGKPPHFDASSNPAYVRPQQQMSQGYGGAQQQLQQYTSQLAAVNALEAKNEEARKQNALEQQMNNIDTNDNRDYPPAQAHYNDEKVDRFSYRDWSIQLLTLFVTVDELLSDVIKGQRTIANSTFFFPQGALISNEELSFDPKMCHIHHAGHHITHIRNSSIYPLNLIFSFGAQENTATHVLISTVPSRTELRSINKHVEIVEKKRLDLISKFNDVNGKSGPDLLQIHTNIINDTIIISSRHSLYPILKAMLDTEEDQVAATGWNKNGLGLKYISLSSKEGPYISANYKEFTNYTAQLTDLLKSLPITTVERLQCVLERADMRNFQEEKGTSLSEATRNVKPKTWLNEERLQFSAVIDVFLWVKSDEQ
jgi:hypothetical protein